MKIKIRKRIKSKMKSKSKKALLRNLWHDACCS